MPNGARRESCKISRGEDEPASSHGQIHLMEHKICALAPASVARRRSAIAGTPGKRVPTGEGEASLATEFYRI